MQYFFILGANPTLSIAELSAVFNLNKRRRDAGVSPSNNVFLLETDKNINAQELIKKIGGIIKIGKIVAEANHNDQKRILEEIKQLINRVRPDVSQSENRDPDSHPDDTVGIPLSQSEHRDVGSKFKFGISCYNGKKINIKPLAMEIKKYLREQNVSCRWVTSREPTLSSVVVEQNKLTSKGVEIVLIHPSADSPPLIGQTLAVQPFKELSFRDYGRPARDDRSGMLPPKLAQIMINLALSPSPWQGEGRPASPKLQRGEGKVILDPFCGSGTILTEAMLMGYKNLIGADISKKAIEDTRKNIEWIKNKFQIPDCDQEQVSNFRFQLYNKSATELSGLIKPNSIDIIITEPYLGPQRGKFDIKKTVQELEQLYSKSLAEFKKILKPNGRVVMIWPIFRITHNMKHITPDLGGFKIVNPIPKNLLNNKVIKLTDRNTIIYGRGGQKIWREIVILE